MGKRTQEISPIVFIIIGLVVGISSIFINLSSESNFSLFIFAGFGMATYGLIKFVISRMNKETSTVSKVSKHESQHHLSQHSSQHSLHSSPHQQVHQGTAFSFCPGCGGKLPANVNFCPHCGARLR